MKLMGLILASIFMLVIVAAKPDPSNMPEMVHCGTPEEQYAVLRGDEPFCRDISTSYLMLVPVRAEHYDWWWQMEIYNSSFEKSEVCDNDGYLGAYWRHARDRGEDYFQHQEFERENCEDGTFFP